MKPRILKDHIPTSPEEWLEYQEHRDRWTPKMRKIIDKKLDEAFPLTPEDKELLSKTKKDVITSRSQKHG